MLEVGSADLNGSMRDWFEDQNPAEYVGIDIQGGAGVDVVLSANDLVERFGTERWDLVVCLEMLEHAEHWQDAVYQMKQSLAVGGWLILTTRSPTYPFHAPPDRWRFPKEVLRESLAEMEEVATWSDPGFTVPNPEGIGGTYFVQPGVFIRAQRGREPIVPRLEVQAEPAPTESSGNYVDPMTGKVVEEGW